MIKWKTFLESPFNHLQAIVLTLCQKQILTKVGLGGPAFTILHTQRKAIQNRIAWWFDLGLLHRIPRWQSTVRSDAILRRRYWWMKFRFSTWNQRSIARMTCNVNVIFQKSNHGWSCKYFEFIKLIITFPFICKYLQHLKRPKTMN